jgi:hypothetical protein
MAVQVLQGRPAHQGLLAPQVQRDLFSLPGAFYALWKQSCGGCYGWVAVLMTGRPFPKMGLLLPPKLDGGPGLIERFLQALYTGSPLRMAGKSGSSGSSRAARALLRLPTGGAMLAMGMIVSLGKENAETWRVSCVCMCVYVCVCVLVYIYILVYVCVLVCVCVPVYIYIYCV